MQSMLFVMTGILIFASTIIARPTGELLFVREAKQANRGLWNLPGGHVEFGEKLIDAAVREVLEETKLAVTIVALQGVYTGRTAEMHSMRYVFHGEMDPTATPEAGDEILEVRWMTVNDVIAMPDNALLGAPYSKTILRDFAAGKSHPVDVISEVNS